jgi:cytidine deaminase
MKEININSSFSVYESLTDLPIEIQSLMQQAIAIRKKAYAPYSKFRVGTAILLDNGHIVLGSNQENAAYPSGLCAERVAIFQTGAIYPDAKIIKMAITASKSETIKPL